MILFDFLFQIDLSKNPVLLTPSYFKYLIHIRIHEL